MSRSLPLLISFLALTLISVAVGRNAAPHSDEDSQPPGLWPHSRPITTDSPQAQTAFDQGLGYLYAFNHDEAIRCFEQAAGHDPSAAMAYWGIAYANGPHINVPMVDEAHALAAWQALGKARTNADTATPAEKALINALAHRYAMPQPEDRIPLDRAYADAMRDVWKQFPEDADIGSLFAEALMNLRPWDLFSTEGEPRPETEEVIRTLEDVLAKAPEHPLALHLYIHAVEASPQPERARQAADTLRHLPMKLGHLLHMPSHIDVRLGDWDKAIAANDLAIRADAEYRESAGDQNVYRLYMAHNHHMRAYAAMMQGRSEMATQAIQTLLSEFPADWLKDNAPFADVFYAMPYEMHLRFGRWDEMLAEPEPAEFLPAARAIRLYARGVSFAALKDVSSARQEQERFRNAAAGFSEEDVFQLNTIVDVMNVADALLEGEILYREGRVDEALASLRLAVEREDQLRYIEPPDWIQPSRHVLGATLSDAGRWAEAEQVYRADLRKHPHNGWALYGLAQALKQQQRPEEAATVELAFQQAWKHADIPISSSCCCLPGPVSLQQ